MAYSQYRPLLTSDSNDSEAKVLVFDARRTTLFKIILCLSLSLNAVFIVCFLSSRITSHAAPSLVYSPAEDVVAPTTMLFHGGVGNDTTIYQGTTRAVDHAWNELYGYGVSHVSPDEARKMDGSQAVLADGVPGYVVQLAVFHQLHCLNTIRKSFYPDVYVPRPGVLYSDPDHLSHCLDTLRQAVQCASDIVPLTWVWKTNLSPPRVQMNTVAIHSCRSFDRVRDWALPRRVTKLSMAVEKDLKVEP